MAIVPEAQTHVPRKAGQRIAPATPGDGEAAAWHVPRRHVGQPAGPIQQGMGDAPPQDLRVARPRYAPRRTSHVLADAVPRRRVHHIERQEEPVSDERLHCLSGRDEASQQRRDMRPPPLAQPHL